MHIHVAQSRKKNIFIVIAIILVADLGYSFLFVCVCVFVSSVVHSGWSNENSSTNNDNNFMNNINEQKKICSNKTMIFRQFHATVLPKGRGEIYDSYNTESQREQKKKLTATSDKKNGTRARC